MSDIDYRKILVEYILYVACMEGYDLLATSGPEKWSELTPEENEALTKARDEARAKW